MLKTRLLVAACIAGLVPAVANADVAYTQVNPSDFGISWTRTGHTGSLADIATSGYSDLLVNLTLSSGSIVQALFNLTGSSSLAASKSAGGVYEQDGIDGGFSFTGTGANAGKDYLTGTYTNAVITGSGNSGSFFSTSSGTVTYTSGSQATSNGLGNFSVALNNTNVPFSAKTGFPLNTFKARSGGTFTAQAVPELSVWGMMIVGFAGIGVVARRRGLKLPGKPSTLAA